MICYLTRRRLGALLDGALQGTQARTAEAHLAWCARCQREAESLRGLQALLRRHAPPAGPPDWTGFWQGVVRGVQDARRPVPAPARRWGWRPGLAVGSALAALFVASITAWQLSVPPRPGVLVSSAETATPGGTVMVYSPPEKDVAVVWLFED
ncbi:MAG: zf-HC2 domain-containing protein [Candidatus Rokubacteria bacterium]|nr:zf-HC2 domain-containing protein [Candidatus Rokubacteria bacterium]